jgi:AraC-like DNA-binding protein
MNAERDFQVNQDYFRQMDDAIRQEHLFTRRDLNRDYLCRFLGIDRNRFTAMMRQHSGATNLCDYLNRMRMEYAVWLMQEHPQWSVQAVIDSCGMTATPFKRCFKEKFGTTPSRYMAELEKTSVRIDNHHSS